MRTKVIIVAFGEFIELIFGHKRREVEWLKLALSVIRHILKLWMRLESVFRLLNRTCGTWEYEVFGCDQVLDLDPVDGLAFAWLHEVEVDNQVGLVVEQDLQTFLKIAGTV